MSDNVVSLADRRASHYITGQCRCLDCKHEWTGTAPGGTTWLECPECGCTRGLFKHPCVPEEFAQCGCGCEVFYLKPDMRAVCVKCGEFWNYY